MALYGYGLSLGLDSPSAESYDLYSYGMFSYGLYGYGPIYLWSYTVTALYSYGLGLGLDSPSAELQLLVISYCA